MMMQSARRKRSISINLYVETGSETKWDEDVSPPPRQHRRLLEGDTGRRRPPPPDLRCVVFDFDSTLSTPCFIDRLGQWAIADKPFLLESMNHDEVVANFGGDSRIDALHKLMARLRSNDVVVYIISIGFKTAIVPHLETVGLDLYFSADRVYGQDSDALREAKYVKAELIAALMRQHGLSPDELLFVDDSHKHIAAARGTCRTFHVAGQGLSHQEIDKIASLVHVR